MDPYRAKLLAISNEITEKELSDLKFVCKEHIPTGILERVRRPLELFDELEKHSLLGPENQDFLCAILDGINRLELRDKLCDKKGQGTHDQTLVTIQEALQDHYKNVIGWLQPLTWNNSFRLHIKQIYTNLELITQTRHGTSPVSRKPMRSYDEMFSSQSGHRKPRRILIEGKAGVGKSTLASEMVYDWATNENNLARFKLAFLIELKQVTGGLKDAIFDLLFPKDFPINAEQLYKYVLLHQEEVLFILDGYDEINPSKLVDLHDLITGKILRNSTVVVTSRPGKGSKVHWFMDLRIEVTGFTSKNMHQFIYKYFQEDPASAESLINDLEMHPVAENIAKIPLTVLLICVMWEEMPHALILSTMTGLFVELTLSLVKRYYAKERRESECDPDDLISLEDIPQDLYQSLLTLGEIALKGLLQDQLIFDRKVLDKKCCHSGIFELGFLSQEKSASRLKPVQKCSFLHRSYQEFLAAFWLSNKIKEALTDISTYEETIVYVMNCLRAEMLTVLFAFTPGLLGEAFRTFFGILISDGSTQAEDDDMKQRFFQVCVQALFESQQEHLAGMLKENIHEGTVKLTPSIDLTPYGIRALGFFIKHSPDVKSLIFENAFLSKRNLATLARSLGEMENLKELHFINSLAAADAMEVFIENLRPDLPLEKLLVLRSNLLGKNFAQVVKCCPRLKCLEMTDNEIAKSMDCILLALRSLPDLRELCIAREKISLHCTKTLCSLLQGKQQFIRITLDRAVFSSVQDLLSVLDVLRQSSPQLEHLSLSATMVLKKNLGAHTSVYSSLSEVLPGLRFLTHLDLSRNKLSDWSNLDDSLGQLSYLKYLNLSGNLIGDTGVAQLVTVLPSLVYLEELLLAWNLISCEGALTLAVGIKSLTKLLTLSLKSNRIADKGVVAVFEALTLVPSLQVLLLTGNMITEAGVVDFAEYLRHMHYLQCLNLKQNLIGESGFIALVDTTASLKILQQLHLGSPVIPSGDAVDAGSVTSDPSNDSSSSMSCDDSTTKPCNVYGSAIHDVSFKSEAIRHDEGSPGHQYCFACLSKEAFGHIMDAVHAHPSLQGVFLGLNAIPRGTNVDNLPKLKLWN